MNAPDSVAALRPEQASATQPRPRRVGHDPHAGRIRHDEPRIEPRADRLGARLSRVPRRRNARSRSTTTGARRTSSRRCPRSDGNTTTGGIVLSGHTDVVPVDGQPWDTNPFEATLIGDQVDGRGVTDMKSFSATGLAMVPEFLRRGLARPLHFALSYDEEIGCIGVRRLIDDIVARGVKPLGCIVGEPTGMELVVAHKGKKSWRCRVRGHEAHSSLTPLGVNAVQIACEIVTYLTNIARAFRDQGEFDRRVRRPVHDRAHRASSAAAPRSTSCRATASSTSRSAICRSTIPTSSSPRSRRTRERFLPEMRKVDAGHLHRVRPAVGIARIRHARRIGHRHARPLLQRDGRSRQGFVRHRGRRCSTRPRSRDHLRPRPHRAGAPAQRMGRGRPAAALRGVHAASRRARRARVTRVAAADRGRLSRSRALGRRQCRHSLRLDVRRRSAPGRTCCCRR